MIIGIGVDLVNIPRVKKLLEKWGSSFKERVFSEKEIEYSEKHKRSEQHYAASFAVKEAFFKAVGKGFKGNIRLVDIEVLRDEYGKPFVNLHGNAKQKAEAMEVSCIHASISHDGEYSVAVVILERRK
jgi:holo-[acyl-carrier protein] synthase